MWAPCGTLKWRPPTPRKAYQKEHISTINSEPPAPKKTIDFRWCKIQRYISEGWDHHSISKIWLVSPFNGGLHLKNSIKKCTLTRTTVKRSEKHTIIVLRPLFEVVNSGEYGGILWVRRSPGRFWKSRSGSDHFAEGISELTYPKRSVYEKNLSPFCSKYLACPAIL